MIARFLHRLFVKRWTEWEPRTFGRKTLITGEIADGLLMFRRAPDGTSQYRRPTPVEEEAFYEDRIQMDAW